MKLKTFLLFFVFLCIGLAIVLGNRYLTNQQPLFVPSKPALTTKFSLQNAPIDSLKGNIATVSGGVKWLSRTATKPISLKAPRTFQQGEELSTGSDGKATLDIHNDSLQISPNSHVSIIQLLPQNFVFVQDKGVIHYTNASQIPISVRSLDLVTIFGKGEATITVDPTTQTATVTVLKGSVKEGYEDSQNTSNVMTVDAGQTFVFDDVNKVGSIQ